ncbi:MAG: hypothetical protein IJN93_07430 [Clostridia bacterium]|nr:hypothetical protein [Clostridia bacterium]
MKKISLFLFVVCLVFVMSACSKTPLSQNDINSQSSDDSQINSSIVLDDGTILYKQAKLNSDVTVEFMDEDGNVLLHNSDIEMVYVKFSEYNNYFIEFAFTKSGAKKFETATSENVGKTISICVDNKVISAPIVPATITDDSVILSSTKSYEELSTMFEQLT